jgi:transposase-like protein
MKTTIDEIRTALVRGNEGAGRPYPAGLRVQVVAHVERRTRAGVAMAAIAAELGVAATTLLSWKRSASCSGVRAMSALQQYIRADQDPDAPGPRRPPPRCDRPPAPDEDRRRPAPGVDTPWPPPACRR